MTTGSTKYRHLDFAWTAPVETQTERLVLVSIASQANDDGWCWPSRRTIAQRCCCAMETVTRAAAALASRGYLEIYPRFHDANPKRRTSNAYRVTPVISDQGGGDLTSRGVVISDQGGGDLTSPPESSSLNPPPDSGRTQNPTGGVVGSAEPTSPSGRFALQKAEVEWRLDQVWSVHLEARRRFYAHLNGSAPSRDPTLTTEIRRAIRESLREHDRNLLDPDKRDEWLRLSAVRAAGVGLFHDPWHTAKTPENDLGAGGKYYLEPWRPWKRQRGKPDPVEHFAALYFDAKEARA